MWYVAAAGWLTAFAVALAAARLEWSVRKENRRLDRIDVRMDLLDDRLAQVRDQCGNDRERTADSISELRRLIREAQRSEP